MFEKGPHSRLKITFLLAIIALLVFSLMSYVRINALIEQAELVNHTQAIKSELEKTFSILNEVESNQRGFLLTRDSVFLQPVFNADANLNLHINKIISLTKDNPAQQQNIITLRTSVFERLDYLKNVLADASTIPISYQRIMQGMVLMDAVSDQISKIVSEENKSLKVHSEELNKSAFITPLFTVFLTIVSILIVVAAYIRIIQELKISDHLKSEIIAVNEELQLNNENLKKANKELESFNYISSHDLQEPLRQIQNFASRINEAEQGNLTEKGKTYFTKINNAANRMQTLIADLLTYSRTKNEERKFEITNLNEIVEFVTVELKELIEEKHATIEVGEMCDANIIPFQFRQLLYNIICNALKFSKPNIAPHIIIKNEIIKYNHPGGTHLTPAKDYCHISISDNGIGFEPQYKDRIFEVFQRLNGNKITGTGIGLAIVKKIVENHNGVITATSELDKGATFDIYIPST